MTQAYEQPTAFSGCGRTEARTNMFVMALLETAGGSHPVKIRNMSVGGAMIEGAVLPLPNTPCRLHRDVNWIEAHVAWVAGGRAGLRFDEIARVGDWLPAGQRIQSDVDAAVAAAKAERAAGVPPPPPPPTAPAMSRDSQRADVLRVARALESLADEMAEDPAILTRYLAKLQTFDIAVQTLRKLADTLPQH